MTYNTGNPLGSTDPRDLYDNATNFDNAINSSATTFTDRFGNVRKPLKQAMSDIEVAGNMYESTGNGLAGTVSGQYFTVPSGDINETLILYQNTGGTATEVKRYPSAESVATLGPVLKSEFYNGNLSSAGSGLTWVLGTPADIQTTADAYLNSIGVQYVASCPAIKYCQQGIHRQYSAGDWIAASVLVQSSDSFAGVVGDSLRVWVISRAGTEFQTSFVISSYETLATGVRRYYLVGKVPAHIAEVGYIFFGVYASGATVFTGFSVAFSEARPTGMDWNDWDPYNEVAFGDSITAANTSIAAARNRLKTQIINGNITPEGPQPEFILGTAGTVEPIVEAYLNDHGCNYAIPVDTNIKYMFQAFPDKVYSGNSYVSVSVFLHSSDANFAGLPEDAIKCWFVGDIQNNPNVVLFDQVSAHTRRYYGTFKQPANLGLLTWTFFGIKTTGAASTFHVTGFSRAFSLYEPSGMDWIDWDPFDTMEQNLRITALENTTPVSTPIAMLVPSSFHLIQGRPLEVYGDYLTEKRDQNAHLITFVGKNGSRPCVEYSNNTAKLDGSRLVGAGAVWGRVKDDTNNVWRRPVTFYTSAATKAGSPKILCIGDSLTFQGTVSALNSKLSEAGVTPQFVGTFTDVANVPSEGRSSWRATNYIWALNYVNVDGSGVLAPVTNDAAYLALDTTPNSYGPRWVFNPFIRPTVGGDNPAFVKNGYIFDMAAYLSRFYVAAPDIVMIAIGTNDHSNMPQATALADCMEALNIIYTQTRAALPNAHFAIVLNGFPGIDLWDKVVPYFRSVIDVYGDREAEKIYVLPVYAVQDSRFNYGITVASTSSTGMEAGTVADWVHSDEIGRSQWAEMTFGFVMNRI
ncbi:MAG: SGNH/GDSL hydrolase family protein [Rhodoferax sp.]|nr:SGNH/GDSL hydrolase family protein [Rhodoferax sp.]